MSAFKMNSVVGALAFATTTYAHGHVNSYNIGGEDIVGGVNGGLGRSPQPDSAAWLANNQDNGFVSDPTSPDIICHLGGVPGSSSVEIAAGETMTVHWDQWPESHAGPVIDYLAPVGGEFASISKSSLEFVKIAEAGLSGGSWAALELIANGNTWPITIPSSVAPGNYVLRHEILALHEGNRPSGTQFYPQCINIVVTGSGTNSLSGGTPATQLYTATDPGVLFDMYNNPTSYPIPGPELMAGGSSGSTGPVTPPVEEDDEETTTPPVEENTDAGSPAPVPTTTAVPTTLQTSTTAPTATATGGAGSGVAGRWYQCGGINFSGPTTCEAGTTCQEQNPYYFQCL